MKRALFRCDGALAPTSLGAKGWDVEGSLDHRGPQANLNLRIESPAHTLLASIEDRAADLVRIAAYVYAADQLVRRGGEADVHGDAWERIFTLCLPVSDPAFWADSQVAEGLEGALRFLSGDRWEFHFTQAAPSERQLAFEVDQRTSLGNPNAVFLFSGGVDSLCAVVEAASAHGRKPLLVGHSPAFHLATRQRSLATALRGQLGTDWHFPYLSVAIHRRGPDPRDYTQRTRSFLYATLGTVIADRLGIPEAALAENGVVSLNLPINDQLVGAKASRSAHPRFLRLFNELAELVLPNKPQLVNPLWSRTRAEALQILKEAKAAELLEETNSCSHPRNLTRMRPHCGVCSQCIDRRFATLAAGLEEHDPGDRYEVDIFRGELTEPQARTMALSYVRFYRDIADMSDEEMFTNFGQLYDCVPSDDPNQRDTAEALTGLLRRHGRAVRLIMEQQVSLVTPELVQEKLPPSCLIALMATGTARPSEEARSLGLNGEFRHSDDYSSVVLRGQVFRLSRRRAAVIRRLHQARLQGVPEVPWREIRDLLTGFDSYPDSMRDIFRGQDNWRQLVCSEKKGFWRLNL